MQLRTLLQPWYDSLRKLRASTEDRVLWLYLATYQVESHVAAFHLEGVELLAWLARASLVKFFAVVSELWPKQLDACAQSNDQRVGIRLRNIKQGFEAARACFCLRSGAIEMSSEYITARDAIQDASCSRHRVDTGDFLARPELLVHLFVRAMDRHFKTLFEYAADLVKPVGLESDGAMVSNVHHMNVRATKVELTESSNHVVDLTEECLATLVELATNGVKLVTRSKLQFRLSPRASAQAIVEGLQKLLATREELPGSASSGFGLEELWLQSDLIDHRVAASLFSAVGSSRSLRKVHMDVVQSYDANGHAVANERLQQWLALALFSSHSLHSVDLVSLELCETHLPATRGIVSGINRVLLAKDPLAVVFPVHAHSIQAHQHLRATASRFMLYNPVGKERIADHVVLDTHEHVGLRVLRHVGEWWSVLLPAWGEAWVCDADIDLTVASPSASGHGGIRRIEITGKAGLATVPVLSAMVYTINPQVETLALYHKYSHNSADAWSRVVSSFTNLRELSIGVVSMDQLTSLTHTFARAEAPPSLTRLQLSVCCSSDAYRRAFSRRWLTCRADSQRAWTC